MNQPQIVHIKKIVYVTLNANGDENTLPRVVAPNLERWMKSTIKDELGTSGMSRLYRGEILQVGDDVVWVEDFGTDVVRDPITEARELAARAERAARGRTEWAEAT
ncbi:MAG: hypothetical protein V1899_02920 [Planctomycetota bacterium]